MSAIAISDKRLSPWTPFQEVIYRDLWIATVVSSAGSVMHDTGAAWFMATISSSPIMVSLMTTAGTLPMFLFGLPAGALADVVDRRKLIIYMHAIMVVIAAVLGVTTIMGVKSPVLLLVMTFLMGTGLAINGPPWGAIVPELVKKENLKAALTLNGVGFNLSRAIGASLAGLIVAIEGPWAVFMLNALSFLGVIWVLYRWQRVPTESVLPAERIVSAIRVGTRYIRHSPVLHAIFVRLAVFIFCCISVNALLPLLVKNVLHLDAKMYGNMLASFGIGAILGSTILPRIRAKYSVDQQLIGAAIIYGTCIFILAFVHIVWLLPCAMFMNGFAWLTFMTSTSASIQFNVPSWVRARALSYQGVIFASGMALGSTFWGMIASHTSIPTALGLAGVGLYLGLFLVFIYPIPDNEEALDLSPSLHWPIPEVVNEPQLEEGPVMVNIEYRIQLEHKEEFLKAIHELGVLRKRDGSIQWGIYHDLSEPGRYIEFYLVESWAEHLRQHERITMEDRKIEDRVKSFHIGETPPAVSHYLYAHHKSN